MSERHEPRDSQTQLIYEDDSIDLGQLFQTIWAGRGMIILVLVAFTALFWLVAGATGLRAPTFARFTKDIKLVFDGVAEGQYPDETGFSPTHLIAPTVLNEIYESNALDDLGISVGTFVDAFAVEAYAPESAFIVQRYRGLLDAGGLSAPEIEALGQQFSQELQQAARSGVRLTFTMRGSALPDEMARKVLNDVPLAWQRFMIEKRGIFRTESPFISPRSVDQALLAEADYVVVYDILSSKLRSALQNIVTLRELPNSENIVDPETGLTLEDLETVLEDLRDFSLEEAVAPALAFGASRSPEATARYFRKRVTDLTRDRALLAEKALLVAETYDRYSSTDRGQAGRMEGSGPGSLTGGATIPQFGSDFLDRLVELGSNSADMEFRQELSRERLDFAMAGADIDAEVQRMSDLVERLEGGARQTGSPARDELAQQAEDSFQRIQKRLVELIEVSLRIRTELERFNYGTDQALYRDLGTSIQKESTAVVFTTANLRWFGVLTLLLMVALPFVILLQSFLTSAKSDNEAPATPAI